jgi:hypothetical protein
MRRFAIALLLAGGPASAAPLYLPTRDVSVDYRLQADGPHPDAVTMDYSAASGRARIGSPGGPAYAIVDRRAGRLLLVVDLLHAVVEQRFDPAEGYGLRIGRDASFTPLGADRVAGAACRDWSVRTAQGEATACLTPDGVILRARYDGKRGHAALTATRVSWGARPGALFEAPDGYAALPAATLPPLLRGLLPAG